MNDNKKETLKEFEKLLKSNETLTSEAVTAIKANDTQALAKLAQSHGFALEETDFTQDLNVAEISDEELEAVAGGAYCSTFEQGFMCGIKLGASIWNNL